MTLDINKINKVMDFLKNYSKNLETFGYALLQFNMIVASIFFWFIVFTYYEPHRTIAFVMLRFIRLSLIIFVFGFVVYYFCYFLQEILNKRIESKIKVKVE